MLRSTFFLRNSTAAASARKTKVLVLFYSTYGHNFSMASAAVDGAHQVEGVEATLKRVPETLSDEILGMMHAKDAQKVFSHVPVAEPNELADYDGIIFCTPTRFGMMAAQMKSFLDATGALWFQGKLVGKVGSVMSSSNTIHSGATATILNFHTVLHHHGMLVVGLPTTFQAMGDTKTVHGCSLYGATTVAGGDGSLKPTDIDIEGAKFQGKHVADLSKKMVIGTAAVDATIAK